MAVATQRFGKHISEVMLSTVGPPLLGTFLNNEQITNNNRIIHEMLEVAIYVRFA
jgi:hypothetical protein